MTKDVTELVFAKVFTQIAIAVAEALKDYPEKEDKIRWSVGEAITKADEFGGLIDAKYISGEMMFKCKNAISFVADLR